MCEVFEKIPKLERTCSFQIHDIAGDILFSILLDVVFEELNGGLISSDGIVQVILIDNLVGVSQERSDGLDARGTVKILGVQELLDILFKIENARECFDIEHFHDPHESSFESLKVPVLIDDLMDNS